MSWLFVLCIALIGYFPVIYYYRSKRREAFLRPFPPLWMEIIGRNVPLHERLPERFRGELYGHINVFLQTKVFHGCGGLQITDEIRVTIAAFACILLLNRKTRYYPHFTSIFVYPREYLAPSTSWDGVVKTIEKEVRLGESWRRGPLVLAWDSVLHGAFDIKDGHNVVLHEFAHKLDEEDGQIDGAPDLAQRSHYISWARVMNREFKILRDSAKRGKRSVMDHYGASEPGEFFAVLTETFFEKPKQLRDRHPLLYEEARQFYNLDPASW